MWVDSALRELVRMKLPHWPGQNRAVGLYVLKIIQESATLALQEEDAGTPGWHEGMVMVLNFSGPFFIEELDDVVGGSLLCGRGSLPKQMSANCCGLSCK